MKKKWHIDPEEVDRLVQEKLEEYRQEHIAKIELKYGNTYISYGTYDCITEPYVNLLRKLFVLMRIDYAATPILRCKKFYFLIEGEDQERAAFIQKFIDNGYKLSWK